MKHFSLAPSVVALVLVSAAIASKPAHALDWPFGLGAKPKPAAPAIQVGKINHAVLIESANVEGKVVALKELSEDQLKAAALIQSKLPAYLAQAEVVDRIRKTRDFYLQSRDLPAGPSDGSLGKVDFNITFVPNDTVDGMMRFVPREYNWKYPGHFHKNSQAPRIEIDASSGEFAGNFMISEKELADLKTLDFSGPVPDQIVQSILERSLVNSSALYEMNRSAMDTYLEGQRLEREKNKTRDALIRQLQTDQDSAESASAQ